MAEEKKAEAVAKKAAKKEAEAGPRILPKFEVAVGPNHMYLWKLINDGKVLVTSKTFPAKADAFAAIRVVKQNVPSKTSIEKKEENGKRFFRLKTSSNQVIATSASFEKPEELEVAILAARKATQAVVIDKTL